MKTVIIIGGGIAGLTCAHELIKYNYNIILIERNNIVGGIARTYQSEKPKLCPREYSWRAYGPYYQNVYNVMKEIPFKKGKVIDNILRLNTIYKLQKCKDKTGKYTPYGHDQKLNLKDYIILFPHFVKYLFSSNERNIKNFSHINYRKFLEENNFSKKAVDNIGKMIGPFWGMDFNNASLYDIFHTIEMILKNQDKELGYNITKYPTNYAWFDPWVKYLESKSVKIMLDTEVKKIEIKRNKIENINILDKKTKKSSIINADYYINCTGPEVLEKLLKPYKDIKTLTPLYKNIKNVAKNGHQIQMSIYYYLDTKIGLKSGFVYLPNTPWLLIILPYSDTWGEDFIKKYCPKKIKEIVSIGICQPYEKGNLIKKTWEKCTEEEIKIECWDQLKNDEDFLKILCSKKPIDKINIEDFSIWNSYKFKNNKLETYEPKWGNNVNTIQYRPNAACKIKNLVLGGAYTNTSIGLFSMEGACESGKIAAKKLCEIDNKKENIYLHTKKRFKTTEITRFIDRKLLQ